MKDRTRSVSAATCDYDLFIVGGGINGCGIARDAVGRGYSVGLCEKGDLASGTSSWSTKLIHGGLRYLEFYEFRLVREALIEREILWANAPHIIWPLRFVLPHHKGLRPAWFLRIGLFLYDHLGGRKLLPPTRVLDLTRDRTGAPLAPGYSKGFEYSDCWVQDSRLTVLNAVDAAERSADIMVRTQCTRLRRAGSGDDAHWNIELQDDTGASRQVTARMVINAAGPWIDRVLGEAAGVNDAHNVRLVQGSHIVVNKHFEHDRCYIFQNSDGRIIFAIPYEQDYTLIGTTDRDFDGNPDEVGITPQETEYLCAAASEYFKEPVMTDQIVWTYSGVRPLYDDGASKAQEATRDYVLREDGGPDEPTLLNIFGGKITTYRKLAEAAMTHVEARLGARKQAWTRDAALPGGDFGTTDFDMLLGGFSEAYPQMPERLIWRLTRNYGTRVGMMLGGATGVGDLGTHFGADLYQAEVDYLVTHEFARCGDDVAWRRSKLGLKLGKTEMKALDAYMARFLRHNGGVPGQRAAAGS
jgi:glycerol-3-phosphate dehydrogenase